MRGSGMNLSRKPMHKSANKKEFLFGDCTEEKVIPLPIAKYLAKRLKTNVMLEGFCSYGCLTVHVGQWLLPGLVVILLVWNGK